MPQGPRCACSTHCGSMWHRLGMQNIDNQQKLAVSKAEHDPSSCLHPQVFRKQCLCLINFRATFCRQIAICEHVVSTKSHVMGLCKPVKNMETVMVRTLEREHLRS